MVLMCLPPDALSQHLLSYSSLYYLGRGVSLHSCSSKAQPLLLTLDEGYLLIRYHLLVKQEMARVNVNILGIRELKWTGMGEFYSDDHYIYYFGQESLRRN